MPVAHKISMFAAGLLLVGATALSAGKPVSKVKHRGNNGHVPAAPVARKAGPGEVHRYESGRVDERPHVSGDHWYGHDVREDARYHVEHAYVHGRFEHFGPSYAYRVDRIDREHRRFWFAEGHGFEVASWDWPYASDWCWDCADDVVVYDDPDHPAWYLIYNTETGVYVHAQYIGPR